MSNTDIAAVQGDRRPPMVIMRERFETRKTELRNALPSDVTPDEFIRAVMTSAQLNQEILACSWQSIWNSCLKACRDGLLPDGVDGALVPFKSTCTWIPMYSGLLRRFRRSGQFKWIKADVVREGDEFLHYVDEHGEHFRHVPGDDSDRPVVKVYALATTKEGGIFVAVMTRKEIEKRRNLSRAQRDDSPWKQWPEEMMKKTVLRQLSKFLPSARDIVIEYDEDEMPEPTLKPFPGGAPVGIRSQNGPTATLDQFAASPTTPDAVDAGGEHESIPVPESGGTVGNEDARPPESPEDIAYERGVQAKQAGHNAKAMPGEYRDKDRAAEAAAWERGHRSSML